MRKDKYAPCRVTKAMKQAGIIRILCRLTSGAYMAVVNLTKVDKTSNTNYRQFDQNHANDIESVFDIICVCAPWLGFFKGKLRSTDGRHTTSVLLEQGITEATCEVRFNCNDKQAAHIFYEKTQRAKRMDQWSAYNAALTACYTFALAIRKALAKYDLSVPAEEGYGQRNSDVRSFSPLYEAWEKNSDYLDRLLYLVAAFRVGDEARVPYAAGRCPFLRGLIDFLTGHPGESIVTLADMLARETPDHYQRQATRYDEDGRADRADYCRAFERQYLACMKKAA